MDGLGVAAGCARLVVTAEFLRQVLHLPDGTEIVEALAVRKDAMGCPNVEFIVCHADIPQRVGLRGGLQTVSPMFRRQEAAVIFEGWNTK